MTRDQAFLWIFVALLAWAIWYGELLHGGLREIVMGVMILMFVSILLAIPVSFLIQAMR